MLSIWARINRSEPSLSWEMAASTVSTPYRSSNWVSRFSPTLSAPSCARMSPMRSSATRMLFRTMSMMSWQILPRRTSFTGGRRRPLLHDLGRRRGKTARHHAPGIRPMAGIRQIAPQAAAIIERPHHLDVHQVSAAEIRVIDQDHVTRFEVAAPLNDRLGGELHHPDKYRQSEFPLGDDFASHAIINAVRAVKSFGDDRRDRGFLMDQIHLAGYLPQAVLNHRQRHGIERHVAPTEITRLPKASTTAVAPGSMTTVVSGCSTIAGPASLAPLPREARSKIAVSNHPPSKRTCRTPLGCGAPDPSMAGAKSPDRRGRAVR